MKPPLLLILVLTLSFTIFGQSQPTKAQTCPVMTIEGVQLGMTASEAATAAGQKIVLKDSGGLPAPEYQTADLVSQEGSRTRSGFRQGVVNKLTVVYANGGRWLKLSDFTSFLSATFKLPGVWEPFVDRYGGLDVNTLVCPAYEIMALKLDLPADKKLYTFNIEMSEKQP